MKKLLGIVALSLLSFTNINANSDNNKEVLQIVFCNQGGSIFPTTSGCPGTYNSAKIGQSTYEIFLVYINKRPKPTIMCYSKERGSVKLSYKCNKSFEQYEVKYDGKNFYWNSEEKNKVYFCDNRNTTRNQGNDFFISRQKNCNKNIYQYSSAEIISEKNYILAVLDLNKSTKKDKFLERRVNNLLTSYKEFSLNTQLIDELLNNPGSSSLVVKKESTQTQKVTKKISVKNTQGKTQQSTSSTIDATKNNYRELVKQFGPECESSWSNFFSGYPVGTPEFNQCLNEKKNATINIAKIKEDKLKIEKEIFITLSPEEKRAYTCSKTFSFKKGSDKFKDCVFKIYAAELEFAKLEVEKQLAEAQLETAKANAEAAQARVQTAKAQGELQKAQIQATKAQAAAARQQAAASNAQAAATKQQSSMSLLMQGLQMLQPPTQTQSLKTTCRWSGGFFNCW
jgi:hypothetical protein